MRLILVLATAVGYSLHATAAPIPNPQLINISPVVSPDVDLGCLGLGISVCNPINVKGDQDANNASSDDDSRGDSGESIVGGEKKASLIDLSPDVSPDVDAGCLGLGISACDPINVGGNQDANNA